jgi:hypothetical protein
VVSLAGVGELLSRRVAVLSKGQARRVGLAAALIGDPPILVLDEPSAGLDAEARIEFETLIRTLRDERRTMLIASHLLGDVEATCSHIAVVAPESRRNGTTQFALSCGVRRGEIATAQFLALSVILGLVVSVVHVGFAIPGIATGAMSAIEVALGWVGLLVPLLALAAAVFCLSLTATAIETYLVFLGVPLMVKTIPTLIGGLPRWFPGPGARALDNFSLLFPEVDAIIPWPHLSYGAAGGLPHPQSQWPIAHETVVIGFWLLLGLWRYGRHDFGSRTAVK